MCHLFALSPAPGKDKLLPESLVSEQSFMHNDGKCQELVFTINMAWQSSASPQPTPGPLYSKGSSWALLRFFTKMKKANSGDYSWSLVRQKKKTFCQN